MIIDTTQPADQQPQPPATPSNKPKSYYEKKLAPMNDLTPMPFGKFKGRKLQAVPASYFHWLWHNGLNTEESGLHSYIKENIEAFKMENPDLIWS